MAVRSQSTARITVAFWLLVLSWACANVRPAAVVSWFTQARLLSHQQRLTADVSALLGGERETSSAELAGSQANGSRTKPALPGADFKKLEVPLPGPALVFGAILRDEIRLLMLSNSAGIGRAAPLHDPPRVTTRS